MEIVFNWRCARFAGSIHVVKNAPAKIQSLVIPEEHRDRRIRLHINGDMFKVGEMLNDHFLWCAQCGKFVTQVYFADHAERPGVVFVVYCHGERLEWVIENRLILREQIELVPTALFVDENKIEERENGASKRKTLPHPHG